MLRLLLILVLTAEMVSGQCINSSQWPATAQFTTSNTYVPIATDMWAGDYAICDVTSGETYMWSTCAADGGSNSYDTELTMWFQDMSAYIWADIDVCGNDERILWTASYTGFIYIDLNRYRPGWGSCYAGASNSTVLWKCTTCGALPVTIVDFTAECMGSSASITWTSESEINCKSYTVSKSQDALAWIDVQTVPGSGNSNARIKYEIIDAHVEDAYYKLTETDFDGGTQGFDIIHVACMTADTVEITVAPNPFDGGTNLIIKGMRGQTAHAAIYDMHGKPVFEFDIHVDSDLYAAAIPAGYVTRGCYVLRVAGKTLKLIRE